MAASQRRYDHPHLLHGQVQALSDLLTGVKGPLGRKIDRENPVLKQCDPRIRLQITRINRDRFKMAGHNVGALLSCLFNIPYLVEDPLAHVSFFVERRGAFGQRVGDGKYTGQLFILDVD